VSYLVDAPDGTRIACQVSGQGPPLVLVHGAGSGAWGFALLRPHLEARFTVWTPDRRGRGESGDAPGYELEREFADVAAVVRAAGEGAALVGHSYGGLVAAGAACELPGLPKLALYEPPMGGVLASRKRIQRWEGLIEAGERELVLREFLQEVGGYSRAEVEELAATPAWDLRKAVAPTLPRELRAELCHTLDRSALGRVTAPVLLLLGSESPAWAQRSTAAYAEAFPDVRVRPLDGHGHGAAMSGPELLAAEIASFLDPARAR
jgi:pimeloyl-ACP methyl ester carboxylesterase